MQGNTNAFAPYIDGGGLVLGVNGGVALISTTPTNVPAASVPLTANSTNYVQLNMSDGAIEVNTSGFTSNNYPIAIAVTGRNFISTLTDSRSDVPAAGPGGGGGGSGLTANVTLSASQLSHLNTGNGSIGAIVIPAPASNQMILPLAAVGYFTAGTEQWISGGVSAVLSWGGSSDPISGPFGPDLSFDGPLLSAASFNQGFNTVGPQFILGQPVTLYDGNGDAAGTGNGTMNIQVNYLLYTLPV
jgi:hypothetical protein